MPPDLPLRPAAKALHPMYSQDLQVQEAPRFPKATYNGIPFYLVNAGSVRLIASVYKNVTLPHNNCSPW